MKRPPRPLFVFACLIAGASAVFATAQAYAAPKPLAVQDFTNETGDANLDWLEFGLPEALVECMWQLPGAATWWPDDCAPPHAKFWAYRVTEAEKALRLKPPPQHLRELSDQIVDGFFPGRNPLDLPANPEMLLTGSIKKANSGLEIAIRLATASGETVTEVRLTAPAEKAIITVPAEAAWRLRPFLTPTPEAAAEARPSLGTESAEAAQAYLEARFWLMSTTVEVLKKWVDRDDVDGSELGPPATEEENDPVKVASVGRERAIGSLTRAISLDEAFALPHTLLGDLYLGWAIAADVDVESLAAARQEHETAVRLGDNSALTGVAAARFMQAGEALSSGDIEQGKALLDECIQAWLDALQAKPDSVGVRLSAANAYLARALDDLNQARPKIVDRDALEAGLRLVREALALAPDCEQAKGLLARMERLADVASVRVGSQVSAAPQALAIQDFKNETGEDRFNSFEHFLPEALAECVWQLPGVARGPGTDCGPQPHAKFWVYRMMGTEKDLRATPPPDDVRKYLDEFVASYLAQPNPLDYPAAPEMFLTGSIAKASGGLEVTIRLAAASGETVKEVRLTAPVEKAVITVPAEAAWELRRFLTSARAADEPRPALGTQSLKAAEAYLEALFFLRWATVDFLKKAAELSDASDPVESKDSSARLAEDAFKSLYVGREYAMSSLRLATALDPHFALPHAQLGVLYLQGAGLATEGMSREDAIAAGREEYEAAVRLGYISPGTLTGLAGALFMEAQLAISAGDTKKGNALWDRSIQAWLDAVRAEPDGASVRRSAANAYIQRALDQTDEAHPKIVDREAFEAGLTLLREAVKLAPECQEANERLRSVESLQAQ